MNENTILTFKTKKTKQQKMSLVTCYDYLSAQIIDSTHVDAILVGDSVSMVVHGHPSTIHATMEMMALHTAAVVRGAKNKFIIADMPFLSYRKSLTTTMNNVEQLMKTGANAIKLEGASGHLKTVRHIVDSGVPVMGHLGLTPQFINQFGGFKVQGKTTPQAQLIIDQAKQLQEAGCFALVLECVPATLSQRITKELDISTIGIGAGPHVDGQILVLPDLLGMQNDFKPKFLKTYLSGFDLIKESLNNYHKEVVKGVFPSETQTYHNTPVESPKTQNPKTQSQETL